MAKMKPRPPEQLPVPEPGEYVLRVTALPAPQEAMRGGIDWEALAGVGLDFLKEALGEVIADGAIDDSDISRVLILIARKVGAEVARKRT